MEEENRVFGKPAGTTDKFDSEDNLDFYHTDKEFVEKNIDNSIKELTELFDSSSHDVPDLSEDEINRGIEKILEITHPSETKSEPTKNNKSKKVTLRVLFIAALLSVLSVSCLFAVGSSHNISIENGFATFAKDTIKIVFFGEEKEEFITVDALLTDLELHGYGDILFPQEFVYNSDEYKVSVPQYNEGELIKQLSVDICNDSTIYYVSVQQTEETQLAYDYVDLNNAETINLNGCYIYVFEFDSGSTSIEFIYDGYYYYISGYTSYSDMVSLAKTIK